MSRFTFYVLRIVPLLLILYFWATGLTNLDRFPKIHEDEAWQAAPGYTFWADGRFGTDLFAGFYGMEENYYGFMPLFPMMVGAALHLFGLGLFQARLVPLILITLTLALTYRLGTKLFFPWHGLLAVAILVTWRIAGPFAHLLSGIPLADAARIVRYDSAVPLFGLLALLLFVEGMEGWKNGRMEEWKAGQATYKLQSPNLPISQSPNPPTSQSLLLGTLIGLATLSHVYGAFWLPALLLVMLWQWGRRSLKPALLTGLGFGLTLLPWLLFVASGWSDFLNQGRNYADRFGLLDIRFYLLNLLLEVERYDPILNGAKQSFGAWLWLVACGLSLLWLVWVVIRDNRLSVVSSQSNLPMADSETLSLVHCSLLISPCSLFIAARLLLTCLLTTAALFALLVSFKTFTYLAMLWPLLAIVIAAGLLHLWQARTRWRWWRPVLAGLIGLAMLEGVLTTWRVHSHARQFTPYHTYTQTIAAYLPPDSRVLGLQHYWLGLTEASEDYRSILVPIFWTNPNYVAAPVTFGQAADAIPPDVLLLDQIMLDFLAESADPDAAFHPLYLEIQTYLQARQAVLLGLVDDPTYGRLEIYGLTERLEDWKSGRVEGWSNIQSSTLPAFHPSDSGYKTADDHKSSQE